MKTSTNKIKVIVISFLLLTTIAVPLLTANNVSAHTPPWEIQRYAYATVAPDPVGPNQQVAIVAWTEIPPPTAAGDTGDRWTGYTIDITKPDGTVVHALVNGHSDPVGSSYVLYTPDMTGTYTVDFSFPSQVLQLAGYTGIPGGNSQYVGDTYSAANTSITFTVSASSVQQYFQEAPLPVSYWTRPINENNQGWSPIASAWLGSGGTEGYFGANYLKYNPYGWAPSTAHVSMTYPISWGGIVGGDNAVNSQMSFYSGTQYQLKFSYPIIMYGNVYFSLPVNNANSGNGVTCVSLRTGETLWTNTELSSVAFGQLYDFESPNQHGTTGIYLWATGTVTGTGIINPGDDAVNATTGNYPVGTDLGAIPPKMVGSGFFATNPYANTPVNTRGWIAIDPQTGQALFNETDVPSGTQAYGPQGEWLIYNIGGPSDGSMTYLWQWNNTKLPGNDANGGITQWIPGINNYNMSTAYDWNVTLSEALYPQSSPIGGSGFGVTSVYNSTTGLYTTPPQVLRVFPGDLIFGQSSGLQQTPGTSAGIVGTPDPFTLWAINLNVSRGQIGQVMWVKTYPAPVGNITVNIGPADGDTNVFTLYYKETMQWVGYDLLTGNQLWGPTEPEGAWNYYTGTTALTSPVGLGYGHLYVAGYGGTLYAYDLKTGNLGFTYGNNPNDPNNSTFTAETVYGRYPTQVAAIANNKVYLVEEEHSLNAPAYHGAMTRCVDAFSGKLLWQIYGISSWQSSAVADGYYTWLNYNDMQVYAMGPGPSATTVVGPTTAVSLGTGIEITGTVTDQTPQPQLKGTPAVSDADQAQQMEYLIQHTIAAPTNITGVPVTLYATDSAGVTTQIAQVMSTGTGGIFHYLWTPSAAGEYVITASFEGSQSYGPSSAQTAVGVVETSAAPVVTSSPTPSPQQSSTPSTTATATATATPTPAVSPTTANSPSSVPSSEIYAVVAAVVIIAIVAAAAIALRLRK